MNGYSARAGQAGSPTLWVLSPTTPEEKRAFFWQRGPSFEIREAPPEMLRPLYRRLPRSFAVEGREGTTYVPRGCRPSHNPAANPQDLSERSPT